MKLGWALLAATNCGFAVYSMMAEMPVSAAINAGATVFVVLSCLKDALEARANEVRP